MLDTKLLEVLDRLVGVDQYKLLGVGMAAAEVHRLRASICVVLLALLEGDDRSVSSSSHLPACVAPRSNCLRASPVRCLCTGCALACAGCAALQRILTHLLTSLLQPTNRWRTR